MRRTVWLMVPLFTLLVVVPALAQTQVPPMIVELITPPSDDLGHYAPIATADVYPVMGVVASARPLQGVVVGDVPAIMFPLNYQVLDAPEDYLITGFRAFVTLTPTTPMAVTVTDLANNILDAAWLPDGAATLQRLTFWRTRQPYNPFLLLRLSAANAVAGDYGLALPGLDTFVANYPQYGIGRHLRALTHWDMGNWNLALADLEFLVGNYPEAFPPHLDLGRLLHTMGDYQLAMAHYQHALSMAPTSPEANYLIGEAYRETGNLVQASLSQETALEYDPTLSPALYAQGLVQAEEGDVDDAMYYMRRAVQRNPRNAEAYLTLAQMRYNRGDYPRAWRDLQRAERWGAVPDPAFVAALTDRMNEPFSRAPRNYQRPGP